MATTPIGKFIGSDYMGGKGWFTELCDSLERGYEAVARVAKKVYRPALAAGVGVGALVVAERGADASPIAVPIDYRADTGVKVVGLKKYDDLTPEVKNSGIFETPCGSVAFEDNSEDVPAGWRLWFLDTGYQPAGTIVTSLGSYNFSPSNALVFGDDPDTVSIDEGATMQTAIAVVAQDINNRFWESHFATPLIFNDNETPIYRDIHVTNIEITPEPATLGFLLLGGSLLGLKRLTRKGEYTDNMESVD